MFPQQPCSLPCTGLAKLQLCCGFNSAQLTVLFAKLTALTQLSIIGDLESLRCFSSGPITQSLEELRIVRLSLPPSELAPSTVCAPSPSIAAPPCLWT